MTTSVCQRLDALGSAPLNDPVRADHFDQSSRRRPAPTKGGLWTAASVGSILAAMAEPAGVIRTPDQRLRVFVSSTLREHQHLLAQLEASPASEPFNAARQDGREAELATIVEEALSDPRPIREA